MLKPRDPRELVIDLLSRSICSVQVAAVICDAWGNIISWGWNSVGSGLGIHAEDHAISRSNQDRLYHGTIYVASVRRRNGKTIMSKPCNECAKIIEKKHLNVVYRNAHGEWVTDKDVY